ncbi:MAG: hypothetical protein AB1598_04780 [Thermodesulfobacteriota bacterium]
MLHKDHGLVIYVDCQPSEQINDQLNDITACLIGLCCLQPEIFDKYEQYKNVPSLDRPLVAEEIAKDLNACDYIYCYGTYAKLSAIKTIGEKFISKAQDSLPDDVIKKKANIFKVLKRNLNHNSAFFIPWYSLSLFLMCYQFSQIANKLNQRNMLFSLDRFPGDPKGSMQFLKIISQYPHMLEASKRIEEKYGVTIMIANQKSYVDNDSVRKDARSHPGMVLIDWIVHSVYSAMNNLANVDTGTRDEEYRESIIRPYQILKERNLIHLESIAGIVFTNENDPDYTDEFKEKLAGTNFVKAL